MKRFDRLSEWQVSERVVLRRGDKFRVSGGPYYRMPDGTKASMAVRGLLTFSAALVRGNLVLIEAFDANGFVCIHVAGRRKNAVGASFVPRPYKVRGKVCVKKGAAR